MIAGIETYLASQCHFYQQNEYQGVKLWDYVRGLDVFTYMMEVLNPNLGEVMQIDFEILHGSNRSSVEVAADVLLTAKGLLTFRGIFVF